MNNHINDATNSLKTNLDLSKCIFENFYPLIK